MRMTVDRVALIYNPHSGEVGSGFFLRADLILTARHVAFAAGEADDPARTLQIATLHQAEVGGGEWAKAICPRSFPEFDLALLQVSWEEGSSPSIPRHPIPFQSLPVGKHVEVEAIGFPAFLAEGFPDRLVVGGNRKALPAVGRMFDKGLPRGVLSMEVLSYGPHESYRQKALKAGDSWWGGMSGAAVLYQGAVVAVAVVDESAAMDRSILSVVPLRLVLDDPQFRSLLGASDAPDYRAKAQRQLEKLLAASPRAAAKIVELGVAATSAAPGVAVKPDFLARALLAAKDLPALLTGLLHAYENRRAEGDDEAQKAILDVSQTLVGTLHEETFVGAIRAQARDGSVAVFELPCTNNMVAEIYMAGVDGRATRYHRKQHDVDYPDGTLLLQAPPEGGIEDLGTRAEAVRDALTCKFAPGMWASVRGAVDDFMARRWVPHEPVDHADPSRVSNVVRLASMTFKRRSRFETYYMICCVPEDSVARHEFMEGLSAIRRDYPDLVLLALSTRQDHKERDINLFFDFQMMLP